MVLKPRVFTKIFAMTKTSFPSVTAAPQPLGTGRRGRQIQLYGNRKYDVRCGVCGQIQLYAERQLAAALTHESPSETEFAQLATIKALLLGQASGLDR